MQCVHELRNQYPITTDVVACFPITYYAQQPYAPYVASSCDNTLIGLPWLQIGDETVAITVAGYNKHAPS